MKAHFAFLVAIMNALAQSANVGRGVVWVPPKVQAPSESLNATVSKPMMTSITLDGFPVTLEKTELDLAASHFGAQAGHQGDASEAVSWLCSYGKNQARPWARWLISGEIDGPAIGGFRWRHLPAGEAVDARCETLDGDSSADQARHVGYSSRGCDGSAVCKT